MTPILVTTTLPDRGAADALARLLVEERLAACAQVQGPIVSTYRWQGAVETSEEWYVHVKTVRERFDALAERVRQAHPYEVPELVAVPVVAGLPAYLAWIAASTGVEG